MINRQEKIAEEKVVGDGKYIIYIKAKYNMYLKRIYNTYRE